MLKNVTMEWQKRFWIIVDFRRKSWQLLKNFDSIERYEENVGYDFVGFVYDDKAIFFKNNN